MGNYLPISTNIINDKPAFLDIEDVIICPECNLLSKLSFLHAVLFENKDKADMISIQYFCFECQSVITVEREVHLMNRHTQMYSFDKPETNESTPSKEEVASIIDAWKRGEW